VILINFHILHFNRSKNIESQDKKIIYFMLDSEIKDFKIKKGKLKIFGKILFKIVTIFGHQKLCFIFKEKTEKDAYFIFSKLMDKLKSIKYHDKIEAIYDKPKKDFESKTVINLFFNNIQDTLKDFEKKPKTPEKVLPCIVFAVRIFLLATNYLFNFFIT
jgi:hypothetical protein